MDNLIVERAREERKCEYATDKKMLEQLIANGQYGDQITIANLQLLGNNSEECIKRLNRLMHYGIRLISKAENIDWSAEDYKSFLPVFAMMHRMDKEKRRRQQQKGIAQAKGKGVYKGRARIEIDETLLSETIQRFQKKEISLEEAMRLTGLSKSTLYRRMREIKY